MTGLSFVVAAAILSGPTLPPPASLGKGLTLHCSFDGGADADFALGDRRVYSAPSGKPAPDLASTCSAIMLARTALWAISSLSVC